MSNQSPQHFSAPPITFVRAKILRKTMTAAEKLLWKVLRNRQIDGIKFRRQHPIGHFIADFYCHELKLVIELDGDIHLAVEVKEYDQYRQQVIEDLGLKVLRFTNEEVFVELDSVIARIVGCVK